MSSFSNYAESGILNMLLRANTNSFGRPGAIAIALCSNVPAETQTGGTIPELANAGSYARLAVTQNNTNWTEVTQVNNSGFTESAAEFLFTTATADWGHVSGWAIVDNATYGAGNVLMLGAFASPRDVRSGDAVVIRSGNVDIYIN